MPGKVHEGKWSEAKAAAKEQYPDWGEDNPRFWRVVSAVYKKMGGEFSGDQEKSLAAIEAAERVTPTFVENPRLWVAALKKSGALDAPHENLGLTLRLYAEMGGRLMKSSMLDRLPSLQDVAAGRIAASFEKGRPGSEAAVHKYAQRVERPGGGYRYVYRKEEGKTGAHATAEGTGHGYVRVPKKPGQPGVKPEGQARSQATGWAAAVEKLKGKSDREARAALQNVDHEHLAALHRATPDGHPHKQLIAQMAADKRREAQQVQARAKEKPREPVKKSQDNGFTKFCDSHWEEARKSLSDSHPGWDPQTLSDRTEAQLRQLFKYQG